MYCIPKPNAVLDRTTKRGSAPYSIESEVPHLEEESGGKIEHPEAIKFNVEEGCNVSAGKNTGIRL